MLKTIHNAQTGIAARTTLNNEIVYHQTTATKYRNDLMRSYLFNEAGSNKGIKEVISFLEQQNNPADRYLLIAAYLTNRNFTKAQQQIDALSKDERNADFCKLYHSIIQYEQTPAKEFELLNNVALKNAIEAVANATTQGKEVGVAKSILARINGQAFTESFEKVVPSYNNARIATPATKDKGTPIPIPSVSIYPNPAKEQFVLKHNLALANGNILLVIYNMMGKKSIKQNH